MSADFFASPLEIKNSQNQIIARKTLDRGSRPTIWVGLTCGLEVMARRRRGYDRRGEQSFPVSKGGVWGL
jgi:hypothetical protein